MRRGCELHLILAKYWRYQIGTVEWWDRRLRAPDLNLRSGGMLVCGRSDGLANGLHLDDPEEGWETAAQQ